MTHISDNKNSWKNWLHAIGGHCVEAALVSSLVLRTFRYQSRGQRYRPTLAWVEEKIIVNKVVFYFLGKEWLKDQRLGELNAGEEVMSYSRPAQIRRQTVPHHRFRSSMIERSVCNFKTRCERRAMKIFYYYIRLLTFHRSRWRLTVESYMRGWYSLA